MTVLGPDCSHFQAAPQWNTASSAPDIEFAFLKATQGVAGYPYENWYRTNAPLVKALLRDGEGPGFTGMSAYAYLIGFATGTSQATYYCDVVESVGIPVKGWMGPTVDVEAGGFPGMGKPIIVDVTNDFVDEVYDRLGQDSIVYGRSIWITHGITLGELSPHVKALWFPRYNSSLFPPSILGLADWRPNDFWQYTDGELKYPVPPGYPRSLPGIGPSDISVFNGDRDALAAFSGWRDEDMTPEQAFQLDKQNAVREGLLHGLGLDVIGFDGKPVNVEPTNKHPNWKAGALLADLIGGLPPVASQPEGGLD